MSFYVSNKTLILVRRVYRYLRDNYPVYMSMTKISDETGVHHDAIKNILEHLCNINIAEKITSQADRRKYRLKK